MSYVFGEFNYSGVHIDINKNKDGFDVGSTTLHELCHQELSSNSYVGIFDFLLMNVIQSCIEDKIKSKLLQLYRRVSESSIRVQESTAMFQELAFLKVVNSKKYYELLNYYKFESDYYKKYRFNEIEFLLLNISDYEEALNITTKVKDLALLAMNIDLITLDPLDGKYLCQIDRQQARYNANYRFSKVIKYIKSNQYDLSSEDNIQSIFSDMGLDYITFSWDIFKKWATEALLKPLHLLSAERYIVYAGDYSPSMYLLSASAYNSNSEKYTKHICHNALEIKDALRKSQIATLYIANSKDCRCVKNLLVNYQGKEYFEYYTKTVFLASFDNIPIIATDRYHYEDLVKMEPTIENTNILVDLADMNLSLLKFIGDRGVNEYFMYPLNKQFVIVFMKGKIAPIFFHVTSLLNATIWCESLLSEYTCRTVWWDEIIPIRDLLVFINFVRSKPE